MHRRFRLELVGCLAFTALLSGCGSAYYKGEPQASGSLAFTGGVTGTMINPQYGGSPGTRLSLSCRVSGKVADAIYNMTFVFGSNPAYVAPVTYRPGATKPVDRVTATFEPGDYDGSSGSVTFANRTEAIRMTFTSKDSPRGRPIEVSGALGC